MEFEVAEISIFLKRKIETTNINGRWNMEYSVEKIQCQLKGKVNEKRYAHSIIVADIAKELARRFNLDEEKAYLAGLLHDCAKDLDDEEMIDAAIQAGITLTEVELSEPRSMLHPQVSAYIAQRDYGISDPDILQAISYHQAGGVGMTSLDKIIGLADGTEPSRTEEYVENIREILKTDLDEAYLEKYSNNMISVIQKRRVLDSVKAQVYNELILQAGK